MFFHMFFPMFSTAAPSPPLPTPGPPGHLCMYCPGGVCKTSTSQLAHSCRQERWSWRRQQSVLVPGLPEIVRS